MSDIQAIPSMEDEFLLSRSTVNCPDNPSTRAAFAAGVQYGMAVVRAGWHPAAIWEDYRRFVAMAEEKRDG